MKKFMNVLLHKIVPGLIIVSGLLIAAYPWISDYMYKDRVSDVIHGYDASVESTNAEELKKIRKDAEKYNRQLRNGVVRLHDPFDLNAVNALSKQYASQLPVKNSALMGVIKIPKIGIHLPIYRGTSNTVLQAGIGHLEGTSLPIGGKGTHCVLTGHTGMSDKKMFTDLDKLETGDLFFLDVLGEKLCYQVSEISIVLPDDISKLHIEDDKDLCTLVTCTPYGMNSHRLLVTGKRTDYKEGMENEQKKGEYVSDWRLEYLKCIFVGLFIAIIIIISVRLVKKKRRKKVQNHEKEKSS